MENKKSPRLIYNEKMAEVHTPEELKTAFDSSAYAVCFNYDRGFVGAKHELFAAIWKVNPNVIITKADLYITSPEPKVWRDQLLLIDKNGNKDTENTIAKYMAESGIISFEYRITNETGVKVCVGLANLKKESPVLKFKAVLTINSEKLVLSISV